MPQIIVHGSSCFSVLLLIICLSITLYGADAYSEARKSKKLAANCKISYKSRGLPRFIPGKCPDWDVLQNAKARNIFCGEVVVAQNRRASKKEAGEVRMPIVRFCSANRRNKDNPILYLHGGPGDSSRIAASAGEQISKGTARDIVFFDQRGGLNTKPALNCDSLSADCVKNFTKKGISLTSFTSTEQSKDIEDIRRALGFRSLNIWGNSYGTSLALRFSRDFPKSTRTLLLESSFWPQFGIFVGNSARGIDLVTQRVLKDCAANRACSQAFPRLRESVNNFFRIPFPEPLAELKWLLLDSISNVFNYGTATFGGKSPAPLYITLLEKVIKKEITNKTSELLSTQKFSSPEGVLVARINETVFPVRKPNDISGFGNIMMNCYMHGTFFTDERYERIVGNAKGRALFEIGTGTPKDTRDGCAVLPKLKSPIDQTPVAHDIPTLILTGTFDPVTPLEVGRKIEQSLSNSRHIDISGWGHDIFKFGDPCAVSSFKELLKTSNMKKFKEPSCFRGRKVEFHTDTKFLRKIHTDQNRGSK